MSARLMLDWRRTMPRGPRRGEACGLTPTGGISAPGVILLAVLFRPVTVGAQSEEPPSVDPMAMAFLGINPADPAKLQVPAAPPAEWPRLPTDDELAAAMRDYAARLALAIPSVRVTLHPPIKMHAPGARNPTQSSMAVFPYDLASDLVRLTPYCVGVVDYWTDLGFHVGSSFLSNCWDATEDRAAFLRRYLKGEGGWRVPGFPSGNYRIEVEVAADGSLAFTARLLRFDPANPQAAPEPVPGVPLQVHAFDAGHNAWKLADAFLANGEADSRLGHLTRRDGAGPGEVPAGGTTDLALQSPAAQADPVPVTTDAEGRARLEFLLDFARLAQGSAAYDDVFLPRCDRPLTIDVPVTYEATAVPDGPPVELAEARARMTVRHVAVTVGSWFLEPLAEEPTIGPPPSPAELFSPPRRMQPRRTGTLAEYTNDQLGEMRIAVRGDPRCEDGREAGVALAAGVRLYGGDTVVFRPADMSVGGRVPPGPREPGVLWTQIRFLDGVEGQVHVDGLAGFWEMRIGGSAEESGFTPAGLGFVYWAGKQATQGGVEWVAKKSTSKLAGKVVPVYNTVDTALDVWGGLQWVFGTRPRYVRLRSRIHGATAADGELVVTTREGEPLVYGPDLPADGVAVPTGRSAFLTAAATRVEPTEEWRARRADALLAGEVESALAIRDPAAGGPTAAGNSAGSDSPAGSRRNDDGGRPGPAAWAALIGIGVALLVALLLLVLAVVRHVRRRR